MATFLYLEEYSFSLNKGEEIERISIKKVPFEDGDEGY
jgi:hypothetical protein